ncbi:MAG TPA: DinB family protein [Chitinophaga sp.]|uniref:DinB family protein n=1 Tax=Chitinophaga sp. TaxID=1869181 RepID=UPI002DB7B390|nr:DinB family protein [Chitinophaga sp.]HEU4553351.1 DinB family protein [Chitinophaga sp.]
MPEMQPEVWLRGPVEEVPALLQPVAHALLQAQEELHALLHDFPAELLWTRPAGVASVGFHLQHIAGVLDRLLTYANGQTLSKQQLQYLVTEGTASENITAAHLLHALDQQITHVLNILKNTDERILTEARTVGRSHLPSTVMGLLFHAAEHTMRHTGQLLVTARVVLS